MYKSDILNYFYELLFSTDFNDYSSPVQDEKTDILLDTQVAWEDITFEYWMNRLMVDFAEDYDIKFQDIVDAVQKEPKFLEDMEEEYNYLREELEEDRMEEEEEE